MKRTKDSILVLLEKKDSTGYASLSEGKIVFGVFTSLFEAKSRLKIGSSTEVITTRPSLNGLKAWLNRKIKVNREIDSSHSNLFSLLSAVLKCKSALETSLKVKEVCEELKVASKAALLILLETVEMQGITVSSISASNSPKLLRITDKTMQTLRIHSTETNSSLKESAEAQIASLKSFIGTTKTAQGKRILDFIIKNPIVSVSELKKRQQLLQYFLDLSPKDVSAVIFCLNSSKELKRLKQNLTLAAESQVIWRSLKTSLENVVALQNALASCDSDLLKLSDAAINEKIENVLKILNCVFDFSSIKERKAKLNEGIAAELDSTREESALIETELSEKAGIFRKQLKKGSFIEKFSIICLKQYGYLIAVSKEDEYYRQFNVLKGETDIQEETRILREADFSEANLEFQFHDENELYFKEDITRELDGKFGDIASRIEDIESTILHQIANDIQEMLSFASDLDRFIGKIDAYLSLAMFSSKFNLVKPVFEGEEVVLKGMRNIFMDSNAARNDISFGKCLVISGKNGKSELLCSIGITLYLAKIGCFVPCKEAKLPEIEGISFHSRIEDSLLNNLSSFTVELSGMKAILENTNKNLNLIDIPFKKTSFEASLFLTKTLINYLENSLTVITCNKEIAERLEDTKILYLTEEFYLSESVQNSSIPEIMPNWKAEVQLTISSKKGITFTEREEEQIEALLYS